MRVQWTAKLIVGLMLWLIAMAGFGILWVQGATTYTWHDGLKSYASGGDTYPTDLQMLSTNEGWAVGRAYEHQNSNPFDLFSFNFGNELGAVLHYTGGQWQRVDVPKVSPLSRVYMVSANEGWAVGANATILHYHAGNWAKVDDIGGLDYRSGVSFNDVYMLSAIDGWIVGERGREDFSPTIILHYTAGQWQVVDVPADGALSAVAFASPNDGWAFGSRIILHYQGGQWLKMEDKPAFSGYDMRMQMVSPNEGWATGGFGNVLYYKDGKWNKADITAARVQSLHMVSANAGWAVGDSRDFNNFGGQALRYDGQGWQPVDTPNAVKYLRHVYALSPDEAWVVGDYGGTIYHYHNGEWSISYNH